MAESADVVTQEVKRKKNPGQISIVLNKRQPEELQERSVSEVDPYKEILDELHQMIGLEKVKKLVYEIFAFIKINQLRVKAGLKTNPQVYHMIFNGNPGTGKTTVARILARLFQKLEVLSKGHLVEADRGDLVGEYIGHTAQKTRELVKKSLGGVLFIDEAYSLARGGEKDFGKEAIDTLVKMMEDNRNDFILILAGYPLEMETFLSMNPGLPSRFPVHLDFADYTVEELIRIAHQMVKEREYELSEASEHKLITELIQEKEQNLMNFSNARFVRNVIEKSIRNQAVRLMQFYSPQLNRLSKQELRTIRAEDIVNQDRF
ncbi:AAA family ATPase [Paenibacillus sp. J2TS4]|uniref:AAA family ATPase n=1 Tax=Paenibacillus sp. J2TS4 TaxID=2807194 RepID=UPI001B2647E0|nr:AAA family ATPase [Paenibacillus sp. J2TS4]GIP32587.1 stage V sporulation protein K [Paenibacillus sp. J2TS4]